MRRVVINGEYYPQVYGGTIPARIFSDTMRPVLENVEEARFVRPDSSAIERREVEVPEVAGLSLEDAERVLIQAGFTVNDGGRTSGRGVRRGAAAYTVPRAGRELDFGSTVTLYESRGRG